jgi:hypothetical protein
MAQIDSSLYFNQQPVDTAGSVQKGFQIADALYQRQRQRSMQDKEDAINNAYKASMVVGPDGKMTLDQNKFNSVVGQVAPEKLPGLQQQQAEQKLSQDKVTAETLKNKAGYFFQNFQNIKDQDDLNARIQKAVSEGHPEAQTLPAFDPNVYAKKVDEAKLAALDPNQFLQDQRARETHQDSVKDRGLRERELGAQRENGEVDKVITQLESLRGNPAQQQAETNLLNIKKFNSGLNIKGDPNNLNPQLVNLLTAEASKIATGGVPTAAEMAGLKQSTLPSTLASAAQALLNSPSPAKQGAFLKEIKAYNDAIAKDSQDEILGKYKRVLNVANAQFSKNPRIQAANKEYLGRFEDQTQQAGGPAVGSIVDGHKFKGGDPNSQSSWEEVK